MSSKIKYYEKEKEKYTTLNFNQDRPFINTMKPRICLSARYLTYTHLFSRYQVTCYSTQTATSPINISKQSIHPTTPARTRFAPSPTGFLHLGSLRTALYNYLLAKNTNGQFILRIEDTDQTRLVEGAEQNIYNTLEWCNLQIDESPVHGGQFGPYRQSERKDIYKKYAQFLLDKGLAYKCYCSKERLLQLRESAQRLKPPTNVTYDRKCFTKLNEPDNDSFVIRFKSPHNYPKFNDLLHGSTDIQPQYNLHDQRFDDFVIIKNDGMPTYHFANVVDDHLMKITHVIRGEEWLASTPKHVALYNAFGWSPPEFVHIPLLTSLEDRKLSKRKGDFNILQLREQGGILPEALLNFVALFGWAPYRELNEKTSEVLDLDQLVEKFSLDQLTKGNAKVNDSKLQFFQKEHFKRACSDPVKLNPLVDSYFDEFKLISKNGKSKEYLKELLISLAPNISHVKDVCNHTYLFKNIDYGAVKPPKDIQQAKTILSYVIENGFDNALANLPTIGFPKKEVFMTLRAALSGGKPGLPIPELVKFIGELESKDRVKKYAKYLSIMNE